MIVNLYTFVGLYDRALDTSSHLLTKGEEHAARIGASEAEMLAWRLIDDMNPFNFQLRVVANFSQQWTARVAGLAVPEALPTDLDVAGLQGGLAEAKASLAALTPEQFAGRDDVPLTVKIVEGMEPTLPAGQWLSGFATTNIYFHVATAYGILRAKGAPLGKADMFPSGF